jgi:hypothetical protein
MAAAVTEPRATATIPRRSSVFSKLSPKLAAAAAAGAFSVAGVAAAVTGSLPTPLSGLEAAFHSDGRVVADESGPTTSTTGPRNHGGCVSLVARDHSGGFATDGTGGFATDGTGRADNHGRRVSDVARSECGKKPEGDRGRSGEHRPGATTSTTSSTPTTSSTSSTSSTSTTGAANQDRGQSADHRQDAEHRQDGEQGQSGDHRQDGEHRGGNSGRGGGN